MTAVPWRRREEVIEAVETEEGRDCDNHQLSPTRLSNTGRG